MTTSRRVFVCRSLAAAGGLALVGPGCRTEVEEVAPAHTLPVSPVALEPAYLRLAREGELERREAALWEFFRECRLCPRECGANRLVDEVGVCNSTARVKVFGAVPHHGEERPLVGTGGSGTVFFSSCNLLCCFCQNWEINHRGDGRVVSHRTLATMMLDLQDRGCLNINLVTPTHVVPNIVRALRHAVAGGLNVPLVYNTGGYDSLEVVELLDGIVDIYLPDFKYADGNMAARYSSGARDYPEVAAAVIAEMYRQVGDLVVDHRGNALRGLIVRHLVMPENIAGTDRFVRWVAEELSTHVYVNLMDQYHPSHRSWEYPELDRRITHEEWQQALLWAEEAGLDNLDA